ncbi:hypothetical protein PCC7418_2571 [Halothece sp. PCC 7418]|nr:hypothetical protein PCC7418_2571 [Halothece sp. PCC 7418]
MRRLTLGTLTTLLLTLGATGTAQAEAMSSGNEQVRVQGHQNVRSTEAFNLVASAYRGEFRSQGVPSYGNLEQAYATGQIDAETLVNRAIAAGELAPAAAQDEDYLNAVSLHLSDLVDRGQDDS